jgi:pilus assembly protein CpaF
MSLLSRLDRNRRKDTILEQSNTPETAEAPVASVEEDGAIIEANETVASPVPSGLEANTDDAVRTRYNLKHLIYEDVFSSLDPQLLRQPQSTTLTPAFAKIIQSIIQSREIQLSDEELQWLQTEFLQEVLAFGPITPFLDDTSVTKIQVNGHNEVVIERLGRTIDTSVSLRDNDHLLGIIRRIAEELGSRIDSKVPLLDRPLPDGGRVRAKVPPLAPLPSLIIEKKGGNPFEALRRNQNKPNQTDTQPFNQLRERIQLRLVRELESTLLTNNNPDRLRAQVEELISQVIREEQVAMSRSDRAALATDLLNEIVGLGPLEPFLNDPEVDEIMINGPFQIYCERHGKLQLVPVRFRDNAHVLQVVERMVAPLGRRVDEKSPMVDGRLRDGSRFNVILPPLALNGPIITIRKFARDPFTMADLVNFGTLSQSAARFLQGIVVGRLNCVVSGGTGSGKTTTLNVLSSFIPSNERIVTIEDAAELQMRQEHLIRLESRPANIEGAGQVTIRDLVRNALRMRPDRIVVGECRGAEALDMLQAMNTGHDGSLTTMHANSPRDMVKRLETMVLMSGFDLPIKAVREQISMAVQIVVHQERMLDGVRRITGITEVFGMEGETITMQDIFHFEQRGFTENGRIIGELVPTGLRSKYMERLQAHGVDIPMDLFNPGTGSMNHQRRV